MDTFLLLLLCFLAQVIFCVFVWEWGYHAYIVVILINALESEISLTHLVKLLIHLVIITIL